MAILLVELAIVIFIAFWAVAAVEGVCVLLGMKIHKRYRSKKQIKIYKKEKARTKENIIDLT